MSARRADRRLGLAAAWWGVAMLVLLLTPVAQRLDPDGAGDRVGAAAVVWGTVWVTVQAVAVARASAAPRAALVVAAAVVPLAAWTSVAAAAVPAVVVLVYLLVVDGAPARSWDDRRVAVLAATWVLCAVGELVDGTRGTGDAGPATLALAAAQALLVVVAPAVVALAVRSRRELRRARDRELEALAREQDAVARAAVAAERASMARELHDIAAHHLSGIALMAAGIEALAVNDPAEAGRAAGQVRRQAVEVGRDLRQVVGLLRPAADDGPGPRSLADLARLVDDVRAVGRAVVLDVLRLDAGAGAEDDGLGRGLGSLAQLTVYRTVQEALTNAGRHAPGAPCAVTLDDRADDALRVVVRNEAPPGGPPSGTRGSGVGLVGMRERAALLAAGLEVGPTDDGGWSVALRVPREPARTADGHAAALPGAATENGGAR
ncbi:sensor histidine kinase [Luteimicrobium sp. DT211]|uniref:sensor histidine kinase n=1 Tax=Luteimicrobium sp. DT211 TaxID=3393412 RepID=UPI003CEB372E